MEASITAPRRGVLAGLGALLIAPPVVGSAAGSVGSAGTPKGKADDDLLAHFIRMRTSPDLAPVLWVYSGVLVVKPDGDVARPVARIEGLSRTLAARTADGSWVWELDEAGYYCDPSTGRPADQLTNPFTGAVIKPKHYRSPQKLIFSRDGISPATPMPPDVEFRGEISRLAEVAGTTALTEDLYVKLGSRAASADRPARPARFAASLATFTTFSRNLSLPSSAWVDCQFNYTTLNSFVEWLGLADRSGVQDMRLVGIKCRMDDGGAVPSWLRERVATDHPGLL